MRNILFVHQSADMYGSDKVLLSLVAGLDRSRFTPIVVLPCKGPLLIALEENGIRCHLVPLVRAGRTLFSIKGLLSLPVEAWRSVRAISRVLRGERIDIVHSNTLAVLSGTVWAWLKRVPHVWHVHEIIERPLVVRKGFAWLLRLFTHKVICNSHATMQLLLQDQPALQKKTVVVWNGIDREQPADATKTAAFRQELGLTDDDVLVALLGRINRWKGQGLLVEAAEQLEKRARHHLYYVAVGSPPDGQVHFLRTLEARIVQSPAREKISLLSFTSDIWTVWDACDIAVVPSTEPEPFGMVALEAMASGRPVVAANHGGLAEIVVPDKTGLLFEPNNPRSLADAIETLADNKTLRDEMGHAGKLLAAEKFSVAAYVAGVSAVYDSATA
ncbi:glycosyltransferase [Thiohalomonas denitrificans]|nr:glycosyltransferase [Thiohalomonas denitrificans]